MIQNAGIRYRSRRIPKKNAMPTIFPQKTNNSDDIKIFDEAVSLRANVLSVQHDHDYLRERKNPWTESINQSQKLDVSNANLEYFEVPPMNEIEVETTDQIVHDQNLEIKRLQKLLNQRIDEIEKLVKENQILKTENNALLPKELFSQIFGDDQIEYLQKKKFTKKISDDTIKKGLKLRFACGTRGKSCDPFFEVDLK